MSTVLLTGFEPFAGDAVNPSWDAVSLVFVPGVSVVKQLLPCVFGESLAVLRQAVLTHNPSVVIAVGLAGGRDVITPERVAINLNDARFPTTAAGRRSTSPSSTAAPPPTSPAYRSRPASPPC